MVLVDTNVLVDVWENDPEWADWSISQLRAQSQIHALFINPVIYAELSLTFKSVEALDQAVEDLGIQVVAMPRPALFLAGKAFVQYRRRGGRGTNVLSDFFIGAHAAVERCQLLTRDRRRYETYFPTVKLIVPKSISIAR
jgi:predicted nucleic acid-binding protein